MNGIGKKGTGNFYIKFVRLPRRYAPRNDTKKSSLPPYLMHQKFL